MNTALPKTTSYRPWISLLGQSHFRIVVHDLMRREDDTSPPVKLAKTLWSARKFSDALVISGDREIPVHRCVLAAASPFFERALGGCMSEASTARVTLEDSDPDSVTALLSYLYTGSVRGSHKPEALLPLAHRLEVNGLIDYCAASLVQGLSASTIVNTVTLMRRYKDHPAVWPHWETIEENVKSDELLVRALLNGE